MTQSFRNVLADDGYAATFQSMGQYRSALLKALDMHASEDERVIQRMARSLANTIVALNGDVRPETSDLFGKVDELAHTVMLELNLYRATYGDLISTSSSARDVLAERHRQINAEGWTPEHDDEHDAGDLACAAAAYALAAGDTLNPQSQGDGEYMVEPPVMWPWDGTWWKPTGARRNLVKAGALLLAEIERIDRAALRASKEG